jgi:hypothetical protein
MGTVIDYNTKEPIEGVKVFKLGQEYVTDTTDEQGKFELKAWSGGLFGCPTMKVVASKKAYENQQIQGREIILLQKTK